jgi:hypothetical protein
MKRWIPDPLYGAKPWVFMVVGAFLGLGMMVWSWWDGAWTPLRSLLCFVGAGSAIGGGAILQLRQNYRARSKFQREKEKSR